MHEHFYCPTCGETLHPLVRSLDFFCRACFSTLVVIDDRWSHAMRPGEPAPRLIPTEQCRRARGVEPCMRPNEPAGPAYKPDALAS